MMKYRYILGFILGTFALFGCVKNHPPEILEIKVVPEDTAGGALFILTAQALDPDQDLLSYSWTCEAGGFPDGSTFRQVRWFAPFSLFENGYTIGVSVSDGIETVSGTTHIDLEIPEPFEFTDNRDGNHYQALRIGSQTWMIENLAYLPSVSPSSNGADFIPCYYVYDYEDSIVSSAKATDYYSHYGVLYNWEAAKSACPSGWHLPSEQEWTTFEEYLGISTENNKGTTAGEVGRKIKSTSGWLNDGNGDNSSGFNALPAGYRLRGGGFECLGLCAFFWSSTANGESRAYDHHTSYLENEVFRAANQWKSGFSVRCLKD